MKWFHYNSSMTCRLVDHNGICVAAIYKSNKVDTPLILWHADQPLCDDDLNKSGYTWDQFKERFGVDNSDDEKLRQTIEHIVRMYGYE